jgi:hypothetical protein
MATACPAGAVAVVASWDGVEGSTSRRGGCRWCVDQGYKNRPNFLKFGENRWNRAGPNLKTAKIIVHCFKISEKIKISKIYVKS